MLYACLCLVSKSWSSIAAERMATVKNILIQGKTDGAFAPLAILLHHCGVPALEEVHLIYSRLYTDQGHYSGIYVQAILEQLAAGRAPKIEELKFCRIAFDDEACLDALSNAIRDGHLCLRHVGLPPQAKEAS